MMKYLRILLPVAALATVLAGCITAPTPDDAQTPWNPPADVKSKSAADSIWVEIRQRDTDLAQPQSLAQLADRALRNNPATRKAWQDARAAAAQVDNAQGKFMPVLSANAGGTRTYMDATPKSFDVNDFRYGPGLQLNYLVINFGGGRGAAVEEALQTVYAANYNFNQTIQDALLALETAYYGLISAQAGVDAAVSSVKDAHTALDAAKARATAGMGTELDVLQAQTIYDQSLYAQSAANGQLQVARGALAQAAGLPADTSIKIVPPTTELPESITTQEVHRIISDAIVMRPDVAALRANAAAKQADVKVAHATSWPSLYANAGVNRDYYDIYGGTPNVGNRDWSYNAGFSLQWTLFDGMQTESAIRMAEAAAASAQAQLEQAELAASADVWMRYQNYATACQKYVFSVAALKSSSAAYDMAMAAYKAGLKSILDLLTAESQLAAARSQQIASRQDVFTTLANLAHSTGRLSADAPDITGRPLPAIMPASKTSQPSDHAVENLLPMTSTQKDTKP
jgi:outer membrane protein TolC